LYRRVLLWHFHIFNFDQISCSVTFPYQRLPLSVIASVGFITLYSYIDIMYCSIIHPITPSFSSPPSYFPQQSHFLCVVWSRGLICGYPIILMPLIEEVFPFLIKLFWHSYRKLLSYTCVGLYLESLFCSIALGDLSSKPHWPCHYDMSSNFALL
jgi:hypothetical protein